ncbi:endonuclease III domain-containing protein [Desulfohalovibrio reitneri]|uniref:endonuclease III domain-containing protein n=1 Tax=Desulfohalovibrio reitneri TaxID=1307759 RepID=UPI0004A77B9A|nr:endonuclease [Desulfohalovibrio reitneri]
MKLNPLLEMHRTLLNALGPSRWWPADSPFEVAVGAILGQNTAWRNASRAVEALKEDGPLVPRRLLDLHAEDLAERIRPAGYYRLKATRLGNLLAKFEELADQPEHLERDDLAFLEAMETPDLREALLSVKGVGPETADSILLYALHRPVFVVDAYTHRILSRHGLAPEESDYHQLQEQFHDSLPEDVPLYNEFHALIVRLGADRCRRTNPRCQGCPLEDMAA